MYSNFFHIVKWLADNSSLEKDITILLDLNRSVIIIKYQMNSEKYWKLVNNLAATVVFFIYFVYPSTFNVIIIFMEIWSSLSEVPLIVGK